MLMLPTNDDRDASGALSRPNDGKLETGSELGTISRSDAILVRKGPGFRTLKRRWMARW
jgi:hypothetical protein